MPCRSWDGSRSSSRACMRARPRIRSERMRNPARTLVGKHKLLTHRTGLTHARALDRVLLQHGRVMTYYVTFLEGQIGLPVILGLE